MNPSSRILSLTLAIGIWTLPNAWSDTNSIVIASTPTNPAVSAPKQMLAALKPEAARKPVYVIPIREDIMPALVYVVRRGVKEAIANGAGTIVLDMNTNGGRGDAMEDIMNLLDDFPGDTYTLVDKKAYSAGAYIAAATKHIYMVPGSVIGAAAPMLMSPGGEVEKTPDTIERKFTSAYAAKIRAAAEKNGHDPAVFEAMVNKTNGLKVGDKEIIKEGEILTLTNTEAEKEYGNPAHKLLSEGTIADLDALLAKIGTAPADVRRIEPTGAEQLAHWVNTIAPVLLLLGILGVYIEIKLQTFGLIGVLAVFCFVIYFFGNYIAGISGLEYLALFAVGIILLCLEVFLFPGTAVLGLLGSFCIVVSLIMAMVDHMPNTPIVPTFPQLELPLTKFGISVIGAIVTAMLLAKFLPKTALFNAMVLQTASAGAITDPTLTTTAASLLGQTGTAASSLRPAGKAMIGGKLLDVVTEGDHILKDTPVKVVAVEGARVVVTKA